MCSQSQADQIFSAILNIKLRLLNQLNFYPLFDFPLRIKESKSVFGKEIIELKTP